MESIYEPGVQFTNNMNVNQIQYISFGLYGVFFHSVWPLAEVSSCYVLGAWKRDSALTLHIGGKASNFRWQVLNMF